MNARCAGCTARTRVLAGTQIASTATPTGRAGFSLVELIIALTILAISLTGLAGAAAVAHRSFVSAEAIELGADAAALVLDSLMNVRSPVDGARTLTDRVRTSWIVRNDSAAVQIDLSVRVSDGSRMHRLDFTATHHAR